MKTEPVDVEYCENCLEPCNGILIDVGIGFYEFWGRQGTDKKMVWASDCCESAVMLNGVEQEQPDGDY